MADGLLKAKHMEGESEFSALSAVIGGSAAGSRVFTSTSSQGLALMHELLFVAAGMRLPIVMVVVNRALSAPINIWNDWQDSISERDSGWIQIYAETVQEAVDAVIQAYKIAEHSEVLLPVMVCMDGFFLSHTVEPADIPNDVKGFLAKYVPTHAFLDPKKPMTQGPFSTPKYYYMLRKDLSKAVDDSARIIKKVNNDFSKRFKRRYGDGLIEVYGKGSTAIVTMGSLAGNVREVVDSSREISLVRIRTFRPFPKNELANALKSKKMVIVLEKNISLGTGEGAIFPELRSALLSLNKKPKLLNVICGLGGSEVSVEDIKKIIKDSNEKKEGSSWWL